MSGRSDVIGRMGWKELGLPQGSLQEGERRLTGRGGA